MFISASMVMLGFSSNLKNLTNDEPSFQLSQATQACLRNPQDIYIVNQLILCLNVRKLEEPKSTLVNSGFGGELFGKNISLNAIKTFVGLSCAVAILY